MPSKYYGYGWQMPAVIETDERICYCIEIPNKPEYRRALLDSILQLTKWFNWARGRESPFGREVAAYLAQILLPQLENEFMCTCPQWRNDPDNPSQVQTSCDDGVTWQDAFRLDAGISAPDKVITNININVEAQIRLNILNRYDGSDVTTINIHAPDDFYNGDAGADRTAALCMACNGYVRKVVNDYHDRAIAALGLSSLFTLIGTLVAPVIFIPVGVLLIAAAEIAVNACEDVLAVDDLVCCMVDGLTGATVTRANFQTSLDACGFGVGTNQAILRDIVDSTITDFGNWAVFIDGLGNAYLQAQAGVADCPCDAGWCYEFDFEVSDGGFTTYTNAHITANALAGGTYVAGQGWQMTLYTPYPNTRYALAIHNSDLADLDQLDSIEWFYYYAGATSGALRGALGEYDIDPSMQRVWDLEQQAPGGPDEHYQVFSVTPAMSGNFLTLVMVKNYGTAGVLRKIRLRGHGTNPFGADNC